MTRLLPVLLALSLSSACGDMGDGALATADTGSADGVAFDTSISDTGGLDTTPAETGSDTSSSDASSDVREVEAPLFGLKDDPRYLVPGNLAAKHDVAAAGDQIAWVEGDLAPVLVVWDVATPDVAPRAFAPPNLVDPRQLALSDGYLVYVDIRYGDPDIFAIDLTSGEERAVVTRPGAQEAPAVLGATVAWEDCSSCVSGDGFSGHEPGREIVERDLPDGAERARTADAVADRAPAYALMSDGRAALVWVSGRATLRLERVEAGVAATHDVSASLRADQEVARVTLWQGLLAWRPSPLIVNPDSMIVNPDSMLPSDVFTTDADGTSALTVHAEIGGGMALALHAFGPRLGWLESAPGEPRSGRLVLASGGAPAILAEAGDLSGFAMGRDFVVFAAPRADNDGASDVHVLRLDLP